MDNKRKIIIYLVVFFIIIITGLAFIFIKSNINNANKEYEIEKISEWTYFNLYKDGKSGVIDKNGNIVINPEYTSIQIPNPTKDVFICFNNEEITILNKDNNKIFDEYEEVSSIQLKELAIEIPYEKSILRYKKNGKYGLINFEGKEITKPIYDEIDNLPYKEGELLVKKDEKFGVINMNGGEIIETLYDEIDVDNYYERDNSYKYCGYIVGVNKENKISYGYIKYTGKKIIENEYENIQRIVDIEDKEEIYLIYKKENRYGVFKNKEAIINNEYENIEYDALNRLFIIEKNSKYGVLNNQGNEVMPAIYDNIEVEGTYIYATKDSDELVFNGNGEKQEKLKYKSAVQIDNTDYQITIDENNKYGIINKNGDMVIQNKYYYIEYLYNNYFIISNESGKNGIINDKSQEILDMQFDTIQKLENTNIIEVYNSEEDIMYLYNENIQKIAEVESGKIYEGKDYIKLYSEKEFKYFNLQGQEKINRELLDNNLFAEVKNGKWGFVDKQGNIKVDFVYDNVTEFNMYGFAGIQQNGKWGVLRDDGEIITEPKYTLNANTNEIDFIGRYYKFIYGYKKFYYTDNVNE